MTVPSSTVSLTCCPLVGGWYIIYINKIVGTFQRLTKKSLNIFQRIMVVNNKTKISDIFHNFRYESIITNIFVALIVIFHFHFDTDMHIF